MFIQFYNLCLFCLFAFERYLGVFQCNSWTTESVFQNHSRWDIWDWIKVGHIRGSNIPATLSFHFLKTFVLNQYTEMPWTLYKGISKCPTNRRMPNLWSLRVKWCIHTAAEKPKWDGIFINWFCPQRNVSAVSSVPWTLPPDPSAQRSIRL